MKKLLCTNKFTQWKTGFRQSEGTKQNEWKKLKYFVIYLLGAAKYLLSKGCTKVGVTGFCMGGALSIAAAALVPQISASAPFYGIPGEALCDVGKIKIPLQCHFGELDDKVGFSSPKDVETLKAKLEAGGVNFELHIYNVGHAFTHKGGAFYNKEACELALQRMIDFMKKNL